MNQKLYGNSQLEKFTAFAHKEITLFFPLIKLKKHCTKNFIALTLNAEAPWSAPTCAGGHDSEFAL